MPGRKSRHFGNVRKLPSGRYQARYRGPDGRMRSAPSTFERKTDAALWLSFKQAEIAGGDWMAPELARQPFAQYAEQWLRDRVLKVRTEELYRSLLDNHLLPTFGRMAMGEIDEAAVRRWRKERLEAGRKAQRPFGPVTVAKAYRLLHAIFTTAADQDRIIRRNPCSIDGAGKEDSHEREIVPLPVVFAIADRIPVRYRALVLLATFADLRWGELAGLRRENVDLDACEVRVTETVAELDKGALLPETPKSRAGRRVVAIPPDLVPELRWHLERFAEPGERGYVFVGPKGGRLRRSNFRPIWHQARSSVGLPDLHFHDLRHTGGTLSAATGASLKELMARLGHSSVRAAMIYQHATRDRDRVIALALGDLIRQAAETTDRTSTGDEKNA
jgi:integrase